MDSTNGIVGIVALVVTPLLSAVGWLYRELNKRPTAREYDTCAKERDDAIAENKLLRAAAQDTAAEGWRLYHEREARLRDLERRLDDFQNGIEHAERVRERPPSQRRRHPARS